MGQERERRSCTPLLLRQRIQEVLEKNLHERSDGNNKNKLSCRVGENLIHPRIHHRWMDRVWEVLEQQQKEGRGRARKGQRDGGCGCGCGSGCGCESRGGASRVSPACACVCVCCSFISVRVPLTRIALFCFAFFDSSSNSKFSPHATTPI